MYDHLAHHSAKLAAATVGLLTSGGLFATVLSEDHVDAVKLLVGAAIGAVSLTVGVMIGIDARMDAKIEKKVSSSQKLVLKELKHLRELLAEKGLIHNGHVDETPTEE